MFFDGKAVVVTGGTGSIGSAIVRRLLATKVKEVRIYSRDEYKQYELRNELRDTRLKFIIGDIRDRERTLSAFSGLDMGVCFHAAAMKHVQLCEENPTECYKTNVIGTQNVIDACFANYLWYMVAISTDKAVYPTSVLGSSKLLMERLIISTSRNWCQRTRFCNVRLCNIFSSRGSVTNRWTEQIKSNGPVTITDPDATRYFMTIDEAVNLLFYASEHMMSGDTFIPKNVTKEVIGEFAKRLIGQKPIKTVITGLKFGEKLHEQLFTEEEKETIKYG